MDHKQLPPSKSPKGVNQNQSTSSVIQSSTRTRPDVILSQNKIRAVMKSSPEVEHVATDALFLITKAAELFVDHVARKMTQNPRGAKSYEYSNLAEVVQREDNLQFLREIIPLKISARQALLEVSKQAETRQGPI